jgi:methylated-DNA-[protein]-cysteine S-methyltransferase
LVVDQVGLCRKIRIECSPRIHYFYGLYGGRHVSQPRHHYFIFATTSGFCGIAWTEAGIARFQLPTQDIAVTEKNVLRRLPGAVPGEPPPEVAAAVADIKRYFQGETVDFSEVRLDLSDQDEFNTQIYVAARRVGWGCTTTYGALATEVGAGREAARDVGQAMAKNPVALIIPCHRVLAAGGKLGGFSAPGGADTKVWMLKLENVRLEPAQSQQQSLF